jgi:hypothetical protein
MSSDRPTPASTPGRVGHPTALQALQADRRGHRGEHPGTISKEETMPATTTIEPDDPATKTTSAIAAPTGSDCADRERPSKRRKLATTLVVLTAAIAALVGIVFPAMLAAAIAIGLVAVIVVLDLLLSPRERAPEGYWTF